MFIILSRKLDKPITVSKIVDQVIVLGLDTDNMIACFPSHEGAMIGLHAKETNGWCYEHSSSLNMYLNQYPSDFYIKKVI